MRISILGIYLAIFSFLFSPTVSLAATQDCVILLHGLAKTHRAMSKIQSILEKENYIVVNISYPSTKKSMNALAEEYLPYMVNECQRHHTQRIHFITHSLGGIILQQYLQKNKIENLAYIVMLAPPNHGSPLVDTLKKFWFPRVFLGPSGNELTTNMKAFTLIPGPYKIGIIAGNFTLNPIGSLIFNGPNDGKVAVSSTKSDYMDDFIILPTHHSFMTSNKLVIRQTLSFLKTGKFEHRA